MEMTRRIERLNRSVMKAISADIETSCDKEGEALLRIL